MKRPRFSAAISVLLLTAPVTADVGVFSGTGQSLRQVSTQLVQLETIDVTITPGRGRFLFDGSLLGMDSVDYKCRFVLRNLANKKCTIQVGFPIDSQFAGPGYIDAGTKVDAAEWVSRFSFIARDDNETHHVDFQWWSPKNEESPSRAGGTDSQQPIFVWQMEFLGNEVKDLRVQYQIPMSMSAASTSKQGFDPGDSEADQAWLSAGVGSSLVEFLGYTTETGSSWAGNVKVANFTVVTKPFEDYLNHRPTIEHQPPDQGDDNDVDDAMYSKLMSQKNRWFRDIRPAGWRLQQNGISWNYKNFKPKDPIQVRYYLTFIPRNETGVDDWIDGLVKAGSSDGKKFGASELEIVRQVLLATYGLSPSDPTAQRFVEKQIWYQPRKDFSLAGLSEEQTAIVRKLELRLGSMKKGD